jgi:hypothetical protein
VAGPGSTDNPDDFFSFVGNVVDGGREGVFGIHVGDYYSNERTYKSYVSGNVFALRAPFNISDDFPGTAVRVASCGLALVTGNTLTSGGRGFMADGRNTNNVVLKNDFARADFTAVSCSSADNSLVSAAVVKNTLGQGVGYHVKVPHPDGARCFMLGNDYRAWTNYAASANLLTDPATIPVHFQP